MNLRGQPRAAYSPRTQEFCDRLGYADCPICGIYSGPLHLHNAKLWRRALARVRPETDADPVLGYSKERIAAHLAAIERPTAADSFRINLGGSNHPFSRGGNGMNGDGTWPPTDGQGCPVCGACGTGGGCPNSGQRWEC